MNGGEFVDTNVLVYAHDSSAGEKRDVAVDLVLRLARDGTGLLSLQVLMEFFVAVTRKIPRPLSTSLGAEITGDFGHWRTFLPGVPDVLEGIRIAAKHKISFWDAMIVRAAAAMEASVIWSEDLNHGQRYEGVMMRNPFRKG